MDMNSFIQNRFSKYENLKKTIFQKAVNWCARSGNMVGAGFVGATSVVAGAGLASLASAGMGTPLHAPLTGVAVGAMALAPAMAAIVGIGAYGRNKQNAANECLHKDFPQLLQKIAKEHGAESASEQNLREVLKMSPAKRLFTVNSDVRKAAAMYEGINAYTNIGWLLMGNAFADVADVKPSVSRSMRYS